MMKRRYRGILFLSVVLTLSGRFISYSTSYDQKLKDVRENIQDVKQEQADKKKILEELNRTMIVLDAKIDESEKLIETMQKNIKTKQEEISVTQEKIVSLQKTIDKNNALLAKRLQVMYRTSEVDYLRVILDSENMEEALANVSMIKKIVKKDREVLKELKDSKDAISEQKKSLEKQEKQMIALLEGLEAEKTTLEKTKKQQEKDKETIRQDLVKLEIMEQQMYQEASALEQRIRELQTSNGLSGPYKGGSMGWPLTVAGRFTSGYGGRISPITKRQEFHSGVDLAAPMGTGICAANDGKVIFAGNRGTYGKAIMVDHGGGVVTLYAHCSAFVSSEGDMVSKGQVIAKVGSTGYSTGPHLHFEVRINGKHVNPSGYIGLN